MLDSKFYSGDNANEGDYETNNRYQVRKAALMNGINGTLDGEHDYNLGVMYYTPWEGLTLTADYNHTARNYYNDNFEQYSENGYRGLAGIQYVNNNVLATGEIVKGKGFAEDDQEMLAYYLQTGYSISILLEN
ncbi:MAG: hypothetical protein SVM86_02865 [Candidatus Cloacimonadota bacterium]|nr:hypothetical protein [Candidatus Cloacimonadota bacterium]